SRKHRSRHVRQSKSELNLTCAGWTGFSGNRMALDQANIATCAAGFLVFEDLAVILVPSVMRRDQTLLKSQRKSVPWVLTADSPGEILPSRTRSNDRCQCQRHGYRREQAPPEPML